MLGCPDKPVWWQTVGAGVLQTSPDKLSWSQARVRGWSACKLPACCISAVIRDAFGLCWTSGLQTSGPAGKKTKGQELSEKECGEPLSSPWRASAAPSERRRSVKRRDPALYVYPPVVWQIVRVWERGTGPESVEITGPLPAQIMKSKPFPCKRVLHLCHSSAFIKRSIFVAAAAEQPVCHKAHASGRRHGNQTHLRLCVPNVKCTHFLIVASSHSQKNRVLLFFSVFL